jgi:CRP/FNR family transcriptional regulator, anaerobic regulatory protein
LPQSHLARSAPEIRARGFERVTDPSRIKNLLSPKEQDALEEISTTVVYPRSGARIYSEGDDARSAYAIGQGVVRIVRDAENGQRQILAFLTPGDLFGLPSDGSYADTAETVSAVRLHRFPWQKLVERMMQDSELQRKLLVRVVYDLHQAQRWITILGQHSAAKRLAYVLLEFLRDPEFHNQHNGRLQLPINCSDLADYLGIARETVSRVMARLERDGVLRRLDSKTIQILNIAQLRKLQVARRRHFSVNKKGPSSLKVA